MVQSFVVVSAAFIHFALLAQISTGLPIPSAADMPESQVLSQHKERRLSKRTPLSPGGIAGVAVSCIAGALVVNWLCDDTSKRKARPDLESGPPPPSYAEATSQQPHSNRPHSGSVPPPVTHPPAVHLAGNSPLPPQSHLGVSEHDIHSNPPPAYTPTGHHNPHRRSELPHDEDVEERSKMLARGFYIDELD